MNKMFIKLFFVITVAGLLSACGLSTPVNLPEQKLYTLNSVQPLKIARHARTNKTLLVTLPIPNPGYASSKMVYMDVPYNLKSYANNAWAAPPANMILPLLTNALANTNYYKAVVSVPYAGVTDLRLDTRLIALVQDYINPRSRETLKMEATLTNNATNQVIAMKYFSVTLSTQRNTPYDGVLAANRAVSIVTQQIARWAVSQR